MFDLNTLRALSNDATQKAASAKRVPYKLYTPDEVNYWPPITFPNLGTYRPKGWKLVDHWLCDSSGFGNENEPALTFNQLCDKIRKLEAEGKHNGYAIIEQGQFQVVLGVFKEIKK